MTYQYISVKPLNGALGAEIAAPPLDSPFPLAVVAEIKQAWLEHQLIVFRDQELSAHQYARFCEQFGELDTYPFVEATSEHPNVIPIIKEPDQKFNFGGDWHTDTSYMQRPPGATCLYAVEVPEQGGDTLFANTRAAFEALSPGMQELTKDLVGVFTPAMVHGKSGAYANIKQGMAKKDNPDTAEQRVRHPIIRTHPDTGRQAIYAGSAHCERIAQMTRAESLPILNYLQSQATRPEYTSRLSWRKGTLAMWDNRCLFHYALNDYPGQRREMRRVTLKGEEPI